MRRVSSGSSVWRFSSTIWLFLAVYNSCFHKFLLTNPWMGSSTGLILPLVINIVGYQNVFYFLRILILFILKVKVSCFSRGPGTIWAHFHISLSARMLLPHPWCRSKYHCQSLFRKRCWTEQLLETHVVLTLWIAVSCDSDFAY